MTLPEGWREVPLGGLVDILDGDRRPVSASERAKRPGAVPYYGAAGALGTIDSSLFNEDLVLLGEDGVQFFDPSRAKAYRICGPAWVNNHAHVLRARAEVDWRYLTHYLNQVSYVGFANGTTRLKLTQAAMRRLPVTLPPLNEQRRIVEALEEHLSRLDAAMVALRANRVRILMLRRAAISRATSRDATIEPLAKVLTLCVGGIWGGDVGSDDVDVDVFRVTEMQEFGELRPTRTRRSITRTQLGTRRLQTGDLLLEKSGGGPNTPVGRVGLVRDTEGDAVCANFMQLMRPDDRRVRPQFLHLLLNDFHDRGGTRPLQKASTNIRNIKASEYLKLPFAIPDLAEQDQIITAVERTTEQVLRLRSEIDVALRRGLVLRGALLRAAFSGQLTGHTSDLDGTEEFASA